MEYSHLISQLEESSTLALAKRVRELKASGRNVIGLTLGEPDFDTPLHIREAAKKALDDGHTHYPPVAGIQELREALSDKFQRDNGVQYKPSQILVTTGGKQALYNAILSVVNPGDHVVLPAPFWVSVQAMLFLAQANVTQVNTGIESGFKVTASQVEAALRPETKLILFNSPSNPSGGVYTREELDAIAAVLERFPNCLIISDEIYEHLVYEGEHISLASYPALYDRVITVNGFAKGFAMTGWRLGFLAAKPEIVDLCEKLQGQITSGTNTFAMYGAVAALRGPMTPTLEMKEEFRKRRDLLYPLLQAIPGLKVNLPPGAFYFYPDVSAFLGKKSPKGEVIADVDALSMYLIDEVGLAVIPGTGFGTTDHIRLSYAYAEPILLDAAARLREGLARLS
jgi:aspartate aminotransferase